MTPHEKELLQKFLNELNNTSVQQKDSDAYTLITESAKNSPMRCIYWCNARWV